MEQRLAAMAAVVVMWRIAGLPGGLALMRMHALAKVEYGGTPAGFSDAESLRTRIRDPQFIVVRKTPALNDLTVEAFADLIRCKLRSDDPQLRKFYVNLLVSEVTISAAGIRI